jgi:hypothetical protein
MEKRMSDTDIDRQAERMLEAALGGMTPHEALLEASRNESADADARRSHREESRAGPEAAGRTREIAGLNTRAVVTKTGAVAPVFFWRVFAARHRQIPG